jgi:hypothetical protein
MLNPIKISKLSLNSTITSKSFKNKSKPFINPIPRTDKNYSLKKSPLNENSTKNKFKLIPSTWLSKTYKKKTTFTIPSGKNYSLKLDNFFTKPLSSKIKSTNFNSNSLNTKRITPNKIKIKTPSRIKSVKNWNKSKLNCKTWKIVFSVKMLTSLNSNKNNNK